MSEKKYIYNGELVTASEICDIVFSNRAFKFGDSLFETIRYSNRNILFLPNHISRLKLNMPNLKMKIPSYFSTEYFLDKISTVIFANNYQDKSVRIRLTVFRKGSGAYYPESNEVDYVIDVELLENTFYNLPSNGLVVDVFKDILKPIDRLSNIKTGNSLLYVLASINKDIARLDDCLILNISGRICEATSSNVFIVKGNMIMTPPDTEGCVRGIMRDQIKKIAESNKFMFYENPLTIHSLISSDEVFITNTIQGPQWIRQFQSRIYEQKKVTQFFVEVLNEMIRK